MMTRLKSFLSRHQTIRKLVVFLGIWCGIVVFFALQMQGDPELTLVEALLRTLARWSPWILLTPLTFWLVTRYPLTRTDRIHIHGPIHLVTSVIFALSAQIFVETVMSPIEEKMGWELGRQPGFRHPPEPRGGPPPPHFSPHPEPPNHPPPQPRHSPSHRLFANAALHLPRMLPTYWALLGIQSIFIFGSQLRERERQALELQTKLTQSQLETLKLQLQPHFLFNALNAISTLVYSQPKLADKMIGNLSTLLRGVLDEKDSNKVTLAREIELLDAYMNIEEVRFGDRVKYHKDISPECLRSLVPTLLLQPIAENAVRHGLEPLGAPGDVWLTVTKEEGKLMIQIEDNGTGRHATATHGWGIGLSNAEARLEALYGRKGYSLALTDRQDGGTIVSIHLPFENCLT